MHLVTIVFLVTVVVNNTIITIIVVVVAGDKKQWNVKRIKSVLCACCRKHAFEPIRRRRVIWGHMIVHSYAVSMQQNLTSIVQSQPFIVSCPSKVFHHTPRTGPMAQLPLFISSSYYYLSLSISLSVLR